MAYELYYTAHFSNEQSQSVEINIFKDDVAPAEVESYDVIECKLTDNGEEQSKYSCIIARELLLALYTTEGKSITWETFITSEHEEWKIEMTIDGQYYFQGFITPDEGNGPFQDKPYEVNIRATNGILLLKGQPLTDTAGNEFDGDHPLIDYIAGALKKTGLNLNIRIYCGYFHLAMLNKGDSLFTDMFQQTELNYRTFMKDATTFVSCYEALKIILDRFCTVEYWNGMWMIFNIAEKQYVIAKRYYVDYSSSGSSIGGGMDTNNYGQIGKSVDIYPINETQQIYARFAVKSVRTAYPYIPWSELPKNNKFERGTEFDDGDQADVYDQDDDGDTSEIIGTYHLYTINDWTTGLWNATPTQYSNLPAFSSANPDTVYRKSVISQYGVELYREVIIEQGATAGERWLQSEGIPVRIGDKFSMSFDFRFEASVSSLVPAVATIYIITQSGNIWCLRQDVGSPNDTPNWEEMASPNIEHLYGSMVGSALTEFSNFTLALDKFPPVPVEGTMYLVLLHADFPSPPNKMYIRSFDFKYFPFVANGYIEVKGDYILRTQTASYPDVISEEVRISDAPSRILKGALLFNNQLTDPAWYRYGDHTIGDANPAAEARHFKELLNIGRLNNAYRRMYALEGDFNGLNWAPENDQLNKMPIGFFWMYREVDMTSVRDFVFVPPLNMDIRKGWIKGNLEEVFNNSQDGTREGTMEFKYQF